MGDRSPFDEMRNADGSVREPYVVLDAWLREQPEEALGLMAADAEAIFRRLGITFAVYGSAEATEKIIPFDVIPRIISAMEWRRLSKGIEQRVRALNAFLHDIYHRQEILKAGRIPEKLILNNSAFMPEMMGLDFLIESRRLRPQASRILITAVLALPTIVDAINKGEIFRFVAKPWLMLIPPGEQRTASFRATVEPG